MYICVVLCLCEKQTSTRQASLSSDNSCSCNKDGLTTAASNSSTMQNVIGPIRISHLYRTFFFFYF